MGVVTNPLLTGINSESRKATVTLTFTGAANLGQAASVITFFTTTGEVLVEKIVGFCTTDLASAGGGTLALGVTGSTALFIAATTATTIDLGEFWVSTTPTGNGIAVPAACTNIAITDDIIGTVATGDITSGVLRIDVYWKPLSADGNLA